MLRFLNRLLVYKWVRTKNEKYMNKYDKETKCPAAFQRK